MQTLTFTENHNDMYFMFYFPESGTLFIKADFINEDTCVCIRFAASTSDPKLVEVKRVAIDYKNYWPLLGLTGLQGWPHRELSNKLKHTLKYFGSDVLNKAKEQFFGIQYRLAPIPDNLDMFDEEEFEEFRDLAMDDLASRLA